MVPITMVALLANSIDRRNSMDLEYFATHEEDGSSSLSGGAKFMVGIAKWQGRGL